MTAWGSWVMRVGVLAIIWGIIGGIGIVNPKFVSQAASWLFSRWLSNPTSQVLAFYSIIFSIGTIFALLAERSIINEAMEVA